jgi:hypothetical protein
MIKTEPAKYDLYPTDLGEVVIDLGMLMAEPSKIDHA